MKDSSPVVVNLMDLEDSLVNRPLFKVSGNKVRFMEVPLWFKITTPKVQYKKLQIIVKFLPATRLRKTKLLKEHGQTTFTKEHYLQVKNVSSLE